MSLIGASDFDGSLGILAGIQPAVRFAADPATRVQWTRALNGLGFIEFMDAKELRGTAPDPDNETRRQFLRGVKKAQARFEQALAVQADPAYRRFVEGNKAHCLAFLDRVDNPRSLWAALFRAGGRAAYNGQIKDTQFHAVPEDRAVRRLIDDVWSELSG
ncbi:MAG: hypothetical protein VW268_00735 [Rhodospirillaceae bacterium]